MNDSTLIRRHWTQLHAASLRGCFICRRTRKSLELLALTILIAFNINDNGEAETDLANSNRRDEELQRISFQQHPQQVLALFPIPSQAGDYPHKLLNEQTLTLALDGVQDPGNLGTIIRIADWFGVNTLICSEDTADAWNPKVVQATMGSLARVNIIYTSLTTLLDYLPDDFPIYGTFLDGKDIYTEQLTSGGLIIMGNEGNGISEEVRQRVNHRLLIPNFHQGETADSLNVAIATAITCSEFRRRPARG